MCKEECQDAPEIGAVRVVRGVGCRCRVLEQPCQRLQLACNLGASCGRRSARKLPEVGVVKAVRGVAIKLLHVGRLHVAPPARHRMHPHQRHKLAQRETQALRHQLQVRRWLLGCIAQAAWAAYAFGICLQTKHPLLEGPREVGTQAYSAPQEESSIADNAPSGIYPHQGLQGPICELLLFAQELSLNIAAPPRGSGRRPGGGNDHESLRPVHEHISYASHR